MSQGIEVLMARHAKSFANRRDITVFDNAGSPLDLKGESQATGMNAVFEEEFGIVPELYEEPVLASTFVRPQQTAHLAGFKRIVADEILNESEIPPHLLSGSRVVEKHAQERWIPEGLRARAKKFVSLVREGELGYQIYFSHGFFIAAVLEVVSDEHKSQGEESPHPFDETRGYIPHLAKITPITL
jgi:broad specificity phosphatase PhoE